jgi:hypothetical protein
MTRLIVMLCLGAWLAACGPRPEAEPEPEPDAAVQLGEPEALPRTLPPPTEPAPRFVGRWAASAEACRQPAWEFRPTEVSTLGEVFCEFETVTLTPAGYDIQASCTAEAPPAPYRIQLSFAESARAMMVSGGPWSGPVGLVYCGPLPSP